MEVRENEFKSRNLELGMDLDRDTAAIVTDGDRSVRVDGDLHTRAVAGQMLVDGVVEHLKDAMVESPLIGISDVHPRTFANCFQSLQFVNLSCSVLFTSRSILFFWNIAVVEGDDRFCRFFFGHGRDVGCPKRRASL